VTLNEAFCGFHSHEPKSRCLTRCLTHTRRGFGMTLVVLAVAGFRVAARFSVVSRLFRKVLDFSAGAPQARAAQSRPYY
jgi:hypothetical protein